MEHFGIYIISLLSRFLVIRPLRKVKNVLSNIRAGDSSVLGTFDLSSDLGSACFKLLSK